MDRIYECEVNLKVIFPNRSKRDSRLRQLLFLRLIRIIRNLSTDYGFHPIYTCKVNNVTDKVGEAMKQKKDKIDSAINQKEDEIKIIPDQDQEITLIMRDNSYSELKLLESDIYNLMLEFKEELPMEVIELLSQIQKDFHNFNYRKFKW